MKLATIAWDESSSAALLVGDQFAPVRQLPGRDNALDVLPLIVRPLTDDEVRELQRLPLLPLPATGWLPPILYPPKNIFCIGRNYLEHLKDSSRAEGKKIEPPKFPIWFTKAANALVGHGGAIEHDPAFTQQLDYEGELAVIIGRNCRRVPPQRALDCVFGYTVLNDVSARDVQLRHQQWFRGKSADSYAPCGPWIATADEIGDPQTLQLRTLVNGEQRQRDTTANMIFDIRAQIADLSAGITLEPGDIIATGTPMGVGAGMEPPRYLKDGDEVTVEIDRIGRLANRVAPPRR
jgi:2-keto-4-pentenoate hydratase/2-oxohepta-3-ene-1,7-dioic acid hydratase in catechol pathway